MPRISDSELHIKTHSEFESSRNASRLRLRMSSNSEKDRSVTCKASNLYMDTVMSQVLRDLKYLDLDPYELPDFNISFKRKLGPLLVKVKTNYYRGRLCGLTCFERLGDCTAPYWLGSNAALQCRVCLFNLKLKYRARLRYGHLPSAYVTAKLKVSRMELKLEVSTLVCRKYPAVRRFEIDEMSDFVVSFEGLGSPLNSLMMQGLQDSFLSQVKPMFFRAILKKLGNTVQRCVHKVILPMPTSKIWVLR